MAYEIYCSLLKEQGSCSAPLTVVAQGIMSISYFPSFEIHWLLNNCCVFETKEYIDSARH
jgi:hypothetical protein